MEVRMRISALLFLTAMFTPADALALYDPQLCYILDGFLGLYGLLITGMFLKERFFTTKEKMSNDELYSELSGHEKEGNYSELRKADAERGRNRRAADDNALYTGLNPRTEGEYKELPLNQKRQRKNEQVYQGLSAASRDTYDQLQMQPLPAR